MITEENSDYKILETNLNKILNKGKAQLETERLKKEEENKETEFDKDEFIYQLQGEINVLDERERKIARMNSTSDEEPAPLYPPFSLDGSKFDCTNQSTFITYKILPIYN